MNKNEIIFLYHIVQFSLLPISLIRATDFIPSLQNAFLYNLNLKFNLNLNLKTNNMEIVWPLPDLSSVNLLKPI